MEEKVVKVALSCTSHATAQRMMKEFSSWPEGYIHEMAVDGNVIYIVAPESTAQALVMLAAKTNAKAELPEA